MDASGLEKLQSLLKKTLFPVGDRGRETGDGGESRGGALRELISFPPLHPNSTHITSYMRFCLFSRDV